VRDGAGSTLAVWDVRQDSIMGVAYPEEFPPGMLLGPFINFCEQRKGTAAIFSTTPINSITTRMPRGKQS